MGLFKKKAKTQPRQILINESSSKFDELGYTRLRDNIIYLSEAANYKVIQIESSVPHECKTTVTANLGVSLGYTEKKVLLIDLDLRRPRLHRFFGLSKEVGIADYILGKIDKKDIVKHTEFPNVDVITRGEDSTNPSLILISEKLKNLIKEYKEEYDFILIDCAPILQVSDFIHISKLSDGVLLLAAFGMTTKVQLADAVKEIKKNKINLLGTVLTMYDKNKDRGYSNYGKYYAYNYGSYADTNDK